jgi:hypothetical protein
MKYNAENTAAAKDAPLRSEARLHHVEELVTLPAAAICSNRPE